LEGFAAFFKRVIAEQKQEFSFICRLYGLYPLSVASANAAAVKSAVVPGLNELPFLRSFTSNFARLCLPSSVSNP
jgi:hypothetical protein